MLDIKWIPENREALAEAMIKLNDTEAPWESALELDEQRRSLLSQGGDVARRVEHRLQADRPALPREKGR